MKALKPEDQPQVDELLKTLRLMQAGEAGILPNGNIVDRKEHPEAHPLHANPMFNIPKPKKL